MTQEADASVAGKACVMFIHQGQITPSKRHRRYQLYLLVSRPMEATICECQAYQAETKTCLYESNAIICNEYPRMALGSKTRQRTRVHDARGFSRTMAFPIVRNGLAVPFDSQSRVDLEGKCMVVSVYCCGSANTGRFDTRSTSTK